MDNKPENFEIENNIEDDKIKKIINIALWVVVISWVSIVGYDYFRTTKGLKPKFCIFSKTISYDDGSVFECTGPGYKYYQYDRDSVKGSRIGGFWIKE